MTKKVYAITLSAVVFLLGVIIGILLDRISFIGQFCLRPMPAMGHMTPKKGPPPPLVTNKMARILNLNTEQKKQLSDIIENHRKSIDELFKEFEPKVRNKFSSMETEIRSILNDEQKIKFDKMLKKFKKMHGGRMEHQPPDCPGKMNERGGD